MKWLTSMDLDVLQQMKLVNEASDFLDAQRLDIEDAVRASINPPLQNTARARQKIEDSALPALVTNQRGAEVPADVP